MNRLSSPAVAGFFPIAIMMVLVLAVLLASCTPTHAVKSARIAPPAALDDASSVTAAEIAAIRAKLNATYRNFQFDEIRASEIPGVLEIYAGTQVLYYAPKEDILILGELYAANGTSLTQQKLTQRAAQKAASIDKSSALIVGEGPTDLIEFVDPDCPHCRAAEEWLAQQELKGIRQLVFFMPTDGRADATSRALRALCARPEVRRAALRQAFERAPIEEGGPASPPCTEGSARLARQGEIGRQLGINATPFFIVNGQVLAGFDRERLSALLKSPTETEGEKR